MVTFELLVEEQMTRHPRLNKPKPRKALGVLESMALFFILAREFTQLSTSANDLLTEVSQIKGREISPSGVYLLLSALERKGLIEHATCIDVDALGRPRQVRYLRSHSSW